MLSKNSRVAVVGGGISGLTFAYFLGRLRPDVKITVFEKESRVGGYINTASASEKTKRESRCTSARGLKMEKGPRTLRGVSPGTLIIVDLLKKMGLLGELRGVHVGSEGNKKYLLSSKNGYVTQMGEMKGELIEVPGPGCSLGTMWTFFTSPLGSIILVALVKDAFFRPDGRSVDNMSVEEFFTRHFGARMIHDIGSALMYGVYATDAAKLDVNCVMPAMANLERHGAGHGSLVRGMLLKSVARGEEPVAAVDDAVQAYVDGFGSELHMENLRVLLKKFPMLALTNGLSVLCQGLRENMPGNVAVVTGHDVQSVRRRDASTMVVSTAEGGEHECEHVRSTVGALELSRLLRGEPYSQLCEALSEFKYTSVAVCNVLIPRANVKKVRGFGFLVPKSQFSAGARVMGVIFDSDVEEHSSVLFPAGALPGVLCSPRGPPAKHNFVGDAEREIAAREGRDLVSPSLAGPGAQEAFTKMTLMVHLDNHRVPALSRVKMSVHEILDNLLGAHEVDGPVSVERTPLLDCIPVYDVEGDSGYVGRRRRVFDLLHAHGSRLSVGGMTFAQGVGVPDGVVSSLWDAISMARGSRP